MFIIVDLEYSLKALKILPGQARKYILNYLF